MVGPGFPESRPFAVNDQEFRRIHRCRDGVRTTQRTRGTNDLCLALETQDMGLLTTYNRIARGLVNLVVTDDTFPCTYLWFILMIHLTMVFHGRFPHLSGLHTPTLFGGFGILPHLDKDDSKR